MMSDRRLTSADHTRALCARMYVLQTEGTFCDIIFDVGANSVRLHSVVIAGCSDILATELIQGSSDDTSCLSLLGSLEFVALKRIVHFLYTGELLLGEDVDVAAIGVCCQRMGLLAGVQMCETYLKEKDLVAMSAAAVDHTDSLKDAQIHCEKTDILNQTPVTDESSVQFHHCRSMTKVLQQNSSNVTDSCKVKLHPNGESECVTGHCKALEFRFDSSNNRTMGEGGKDNVITQATDEKTGLDPSNDGCCVAAKDLVLATDGHLVCTTAARCTTRETGKLREGENGGNVKCITRRLSKKLTSACKDSGDGVVCRRSGRVKQVPKRYCEDIAWGITPGHVGTFGTQCGTGQSQMVKGDAQLDCRWDPVVDSETKGSNCEHNSQCNSDEDVKPPSNVQHRTVMSLRSNSAMQESHKRSLSVGGQLSPNEANRMDYNCIKETITAAVELEDVPSIPSCKMTSQRAPTGHRGKYKCRKCSICKETFATSDILVVHRKSCHQRARGPNPRKYDCEQCPYVARTEKLLLIHMNNRHDVPLAVQDKFPVHMCEVAGCDYKSLYKQYIWRHHEAQHTNLKFVCEYCGKALRSKLALTQHVRIHLGVKPYVCQICGRTFRQSSILKCHQRSVHETHPHHLLCHECPYTTSKKTSLDLHRYRRHAVALPSNISVYYCDICKFETVSKSTLQCHVRRHLGQRPFECTLCHKTFVSSDDLRGHAVWHLPMSERKHKCPYEASEGCQYVAATNSKLTSHVRLQHTHKDDRPFTCHLCPYKTGVKGNLTKHLRSVHHLEVMTHQVRVMPFCQGSTAPAIGLASAKSMAEVSSNITRVSMTSDILTPIMMSSSSELMGLDSAMLGSDALLRQPDDI